MAAPGRDVRVKLLFPYPPPAVPHCRHLWFMLDAERCRAVTDVSALIRERFFSGLRGALSLYLDGGLLPPGESARLIRDNDVISVEWEEDPPNDSPQETSKKRRRSQDDCKKTKRGHMEAPERTMKNVPTLEEEEQVERPRKKRVRIQEEVSKRPTKQKKKVVTPEDETLQQPRKKVTPEEKVLQQPRKKVTPEEGEVQERPRKEKTKEVVTVEVKVSDRPRKKVTIEEQVSKRMKREKMQHPQEEMSSETSEHKPRIQDLSTEPGTKKPQHQGAVCSSVQEKVSPSSSSSSEGEDMGHRRGGEPGPPPRRQQREASSSPDSLIIKRPAAPAISPSPPVHNGHATRGGAWHTPPPIAAGRGVGRGRSPDNLHWRGRGIRGKGESPIQNHFFYNNKPETMKENQLKEEVRNVSMLIQNPPEVLKKDYSVFPLLAAPPQPGTVIAFKLLELTENYTPEVSEYKEGRLLSYDLYNPL
ncbi:coilin isoform X2 [Engystomops pustulosus]|uniref:coilin isoform X2 n=1 Tax=Engystomops pustulosus TaxID=76066 RepID=UPI003AFA77F0